MYKNISKTLSPKESKKKNFWPMTVHSKNQKRPPQNKTTPSTNDNKQNKRKNTHKPFDVAADRWSAMSRLKWVFPSQLSTVRNSLVSGLNCLVVPDSYFLWKERGYRNSSWCSGWILGGRCGPNQWWDDKQGFPMRQGVLTQRKTCLLLSKEHFVLKQG